MGIAALILGIVGIVFPGLGILFSIAALILGIIAFKRRKKRGLGLAGIITGGIGIILGPILAAIAIPSFIGYERRAKAAETEINLDRMYYGASEYLGSFAALPQSTGWTPAMPCCQQTGGTCSPVDNAQAWDTPTWRALRFAIEDPFYYQYRFLVEGDRVLFQARGDLDCDGELSMFESEARISGSNLERSSQVYQENPTE